MFTLTKHPAIISVSDGIQDAARHLGQTWRVWLPVAVAIGLISLVVYAIMYSVIGTVDSTDLYTINEQKAYVVTGKDTPDSPEKFLIRLVKNNVFTEMGYINSLTEIQNYARIVEKRIK